MKKWYIITLLCICFTCSLSAQQLSLETAITRSSEGIENALSLKAKVAVLNFVSPTKAFSDHVIEELTGKLVTNRKVTIVDRQNLALINQEMMLQLSGEVSDESAQVIGRMLGASSIVTGNLTNMGSYYRFRIKVISVETAEIQTQIALNLQNDSQVAFLLQESPTNTQASIPFSSFSSTTDGKSKIWSPIVFIGGGMTWLTNGLYTYSDATEDMKSIFGFKVGASLDIQPKDALYIINFGLNYNTSGCEYVSTPRNNLTFTRNISLSLLDIFAKIKYDKELSSTLSLEPYLGVAASYFLRRYEEWERKDTFYGFSESGNNEGMDYTNELRPCLLIGADVDFNDMFLLGVEYKLNSYSGAIMLNLGYKF